MHRLLAVLRRPDILLGLVTEPVVAKPLSIGDDPGDEPLAAPYRLTIAPLSQVSELLCPWKDKDIRAWRALSRVPNPSRRAAVAMVRTLIGSAVDPSCDATVPESIDYTRGPVDFRPILCDPTGERRVLADLEEILIEATAGVEFPDWHWTRRADIAELPPLFRTLFLWGLHLSSWDRLQATRELFDAMALAERPEVAIALARMMTHGSRGASLAWATRIAELPANRQADTAYLLVETGAVALDGSRLSDIDLRSSRAAVFAALGDAASRGPVAVARAQA